MRRSKAGTIEQARLMHTQTSTYLQQSCSDNKRKQTKGTDSQSQKETAKEIYYRLRPTHGNTHNNSTWQDWRHPQTFTQNPKEKQSGDFPARVVPLGDRSLESLRRGALSSCRAYLPPCARQLGRGFWGSSIGFRPLSRCGRGGEWQVLRSERYSQKDT